MQRSVDQTVPATPNPQGQPIQQPMKGQLPAPLPLNEELLRQVGGGLTPGGNW
jgi:hypothetical protein